VEQRRVAQVAQLVLAHVETLAHGDRVRRDLPLVILAVVVARDDRGHERRDRRQVGLVEFAVEADRAHRRRTDAREDAMSSRSSSVKTCGSRQVTKRTPMVWSAERSG